MTDAHNTAPADPRVYIAQSLEGMKAATAAHCGSWHLDQAERWSVDMDEGLIRFVLPDGMHARPLSRSSAPPTATTDPSCGAGITRPCRRNWPNTPSWRAFGEAHGLPEYSNRKVECDDMRAWEFAAVAMRLGGASGTYRGQASETACVWMTFGAVTLSQG